MSVDSTSRKTSFSSTAVADYSFTWRALTSAPSDIKVRVETSGTVSSLTYTTDYSVAINSNGVGGKITLVTTYGTGTHTITVYRETTNKQESDYADYNQFPSDTLEGDLDRRTMLAQEMAEDISRSAKVDVTSTISSLAIPTPATGRCWVWTGNTLRNSTYDIDTQQAAAVAAATAATTAQTAAEAANTAATAATTAAQSESTTSGSHAVASLTYATNSLSHVTTALTYSNSASSHATTALTNSNTSTTQATLASSHAVTALTHSNSATTQATAASSHATTSITNSTLAGNYATTASTGATQASSHATTALTHSNTASSYSTNALTSSNLASSYSTNALTYSTTAQAAALKTTDIIWIGPNGDYATIQAALNANPTAGTTFLVAEGTYTEQVTFTADNQVLKAWGSKENTTITQAAATVVNFSTKSGCVLQGFTVSVTAADGVTDYCIISANDDTTIDNFVIDCDVKWTASGAIADHRCVYITDGGMTFRNTRLEIDSNYASTSSNNGAIVAVIAAAHTYTFIHCVFVGNWANTGTQLAEGIRNAAGASTIEVLDCEFDIDSACATSGWADALSLNVASVTFNVRNTKMVVDVSGSGNAYGYYMATGGVINSYNNVYDITNNDADSKWALVGASTTLNSYGDHIIDGTLSNAGTFSTTFIAGVLTAQSISTTTQSMRVDIGGVGYYIPLLPV